MLFRVTNDANKLSGDTNFGLALFTMLVYLMINYNTKIDHFTISDGFESGFESI